MSTKSSGLIINDGASLCPFDLAYHVSETIRFLLVIDSSGSSHLFSLSVSCQVKSRYTELTGIFLQTHHTSVLKVPCSMILSRLTTSSISTSYSECEGTGFPCKSGDLEEKMTLVVLANCMTPVRLSELTSTDMILFFSK